MITPDYFTDEEYREVTGDSKEPLKVQPEDVERGQIEAIERLEIWARTAWQVREVTQTLRVDIPSFLIHKTPIVEVSEFLVDDVSFTDVDYIIDLENGIVRWDDWTTGAPVFEPRAAVTITYTYGFDEVPMAVKRPLIQAVRNLLTYEEGRSKLPRNVSSYGTERASFQMRADRGLIRPWPWDERSSQDVRSYWEQFRPKSYITA